MNRYSFLTPPGTVLVNGATGETIFDTGTAGGFCTEELMESLSKKMCERAAAIFPKCTETLVTVFDDGEESRTAKVTATFTEEEEDEEGEIITKTTVYEARYVDAKAAFVLFLSPGEYTLRARSGVYSSPEETVEITTDENMFTLEIERGDE